MEPRPLFENGTPPVTNGRGPEPRPLTFPAEAKAVAPAAKPAPQAQQAKPATSAAAAPAPGPLDFSNVKTPAKPAPAGQAVFGRTMHAAQSAAEDAAKKIDAELFRQQEERIRRMIATLLPVNVEKIESCGLTVLDRQRESTAALTELTRRLTTLDVGNLLAQAAEVARPKTGFIDKLKAKIRPVENLEPALRQAAAELRTLLPLIRELRPKALENDIRFSAQFLALRAVATAAGEGGDPSLMQLMHQRLDTLRVGLTQAKMIPLHLQQMEQTAQTYHEQCEQVLNVTLAAGALVQAQPTR